MLAKRSPLPVSSVIAFSIRLGSEAVRVGQAAGYVLEDILNIRPEVLAAAGEGAAEALGAAEDILAAGAKKRAEGQRPSMGQDMVKGRRTEIEFMNGLVVDKGREVGVATPANAALTEIVKKVERGELVPDIRHILELRL